MFPKLPALWISHFPPRSGSKYRVFTEGNWSNYYLIFIYEKALVQGKQDNKVMGWEHKGRLGDTCNEDEENGIVSMSVGIRKERNKTWNRRIKKIDEMWRARNRDTKKKQRYKKEIAIIHCMRPMGNKKREKDDRREDQRGTITKIRAQ